MKDCLLGKTARRNEVPPVFVLDFFVHISNLNFFLTRYRNFRTFTTPRPVQFSCLAIDATDEFVAAGAQDVFDIYLWSMKLGQLIEVNNLEIFETARNP